jgi:hypothetical protein
MNFSRLLTPSRVFLAAGLGLFLASCSTKSVGEGATIYKVNPYHLIDAKEQGKAADRSLRFEHERKLHGAISDAERAERQGDYYTVFWKVKDRSQPVTVRFEYKQKATGLKLKVLEQEVTDIGRSNTTDFSVIGNDYLVNGPVTAWRVVLLRGKDTLVTYNSYLWE